MEPVRLGLIGIGRWARETHLKNLAQMDTAQVVALASRSRENLEAGRALVGGEVRLFQDYRDLLRWEEVEAVILCVPNDLHARVSIEALQAGKHVLCEKPLGLSLEECDAVLRAQRETGKVLQVGLELRYGQVVERARTLLHRGEIGALTLQEIFFQRPPRTPVGWRQEPHRSGGFFLEVGCHYLDLLEVFAGSPIASVQGRAGRWLQGPFWDHGAIVAEHRNGVFSLFRFCTFGPQREIILDLSGSHGQLRVRFASREVECFQRETNDYLLHRVGEPESHRTYGYDGSFELLQEFLRCVRTGDRPQTDGQVGRHSVAVALACEEAVQQGKPMEVKE